MNTITRLIVIVTLGVMGCEPVPQGGKPAVPKPSPIAKKSDDRVMSDPVGIRLSSTEFTVAKADEDAKDAKDAKEPPAFAGWKRARLGDGVWMETQGAKGEKRRVLVSAKVCLREGSYALECLLCRSNTKEHESILATSADARVIHTALVAAGAKPGAPVSYEPKFQPPQGQPIKITLAYTKKGEVVTVPAQQWILDKKTKKPLELEWVFAGSKVFPNEDAAKLPHYAANLDGGYICITNLVSALLDLPINSPKPIDDRICDFNTPKIPAVDTSVVLILEPIPVKK